MYFASVGAKKDLPDPVGALQTMNFSPFEIDCSIFFRILTCDDDGVYDSGKLSIKLDISNSLT
jgi:hypothetical protein